ncbi:phage baseplate protein [Dryocola sp. BD626]|uniref:phage baseplate protein n=1 Tax=Dryocola sp. BD626 TaxID=3133273 RepID=UPI003F4F4551
MAEITLKYLTDLPSATEADVGDLLHVNQSGNDRSMTISVLLKSVIDAVYPVNSAHFFADATNPNVTWPGTTWARIPGAGKTIRLANTTGSDVLQQGGSDAITLSTANLPTHFHTVDLKTGQFDHGTKSTGEDNHSHTVPLKSIGRLTGGSYDGSSDDIVSTQSTNTSNYKHAHTVAIGAHDHPVKGNTGNAGAGSEFTIANQYVKLAGWYRTA